MRKLKESWLLILALLPFLIIVFAFEILPLLSVIDDSFRTEDGAFTLQQYSKIFSNVFYTQGIVNSISISIYSSLIGIVIAVIGAYSITRLNSKTKDTVLLLSNMTSNFSGVPLAFAFMIILGNTGLFTILLKHMGINLTKFFNLYSGMGVAAVYIYFQIPLAILLMYPAYDAVKSEWKEACLMLGGSKIDFWRQIGFPILSPTIFGTIVVLFANSMGAYATVIALTNGNYNLIPVRIGALISGDIVSKPELASALSIVLAFIIILINVINETLLKKRRWI